MPASRIARSLLVVSLGLLLLAGAAPPAVAAGASDLAVIVASSTSSPAVGDDLHYMLTVVNGGPDQATNVTVTDDLPSSSLISFGGATPSQGTCNPLSGSTVTCNLGTLTAFSLATVDILVAPLAPGTLTDTANISSDSTDPTSSNNQSSRSPTSTGLTCTIVGTWGNDTFTGTAGTDTICGLGGTDLLYGGDGDDTLNGGDGDDFLSGGTGVNQLFGGTGANTCLQAGVGGTRDCEGRLRTDPDDTSGLLDLSRAVVSRSSGLTIRLRTFAPWSIVGVWDRGFFFVSLDTRRDANPDYKIAIRSNRTSMRGLLFKVGSNTPLEVLPVTRPDSHSVSIAVPLDQLTFGVARAYVRWSAESVWNDTPCSSVCFDLAPDAGMPPEPVP